MAVSLISTLSLLLVVASAASAINLRDLPIANITTPTDAITTPAVPDAPIWTVVETPSESPLFKPHLESSVNDFSAHQPQQTESALPISIGDVGSIIASLLPPASTAHTETSATEFQDIQNPTKTVIPTATDMQIDVQEPTETEEPWEHGKPDRDNQRPRLEASVDGFDDIQTDVSPLPGEKASPTPTITIDDVVILTPVPATSIKVGEVTLRPGGDTATVGNGPTKTSVHLDPSGTPIIVVGTSTSTHFPPVTVGTKIATPIPSGLIVDGQTVTKEGPPITVGSGPTASTLTINAAGETVAVVNSGTLTFHAPSTHAFVIGDVTASVVATDFEYNAGSSTLAVGRPVTINNIVMSLTTDDSNGATVLIAGGTTSTVAPARTAEALPFDIVTAIVSGTTQYIIDSQTLAPGHPITMDGTPLSLTTASGVIVLVVGTQTTVLPPVATGSQARVSMSAKPQGAGYTARSDFWKVIGLGALALLGLG